MIWPAFIFLMTCFFSKFQMDAFALGVTLWAMVTQRMPKDIDRMLEMSKAVPFLGSLVRVLIWKVAKDRPTVGNLLAKMRSMHGGKFRDMIDSL